MEKVKKAYDGKSEMVSFWIAFLVVSAGAMAL
jgi:hypothetical protein